MIIVPVVGEKAHTSAFQAVTKKNEYCKTLCRKNYTPQQMEEFQVMKEIFLFPPTLSKSICCRCLSKNIWAVETGLREKRRVKDEQMLRNRGG